MSVTQMMIQHLPMLQCAVSTHHVSGTTVNVHTTRRALVMWISTTVLYSEYFHHKNARPRIQIDLDLSFKTRAFLNLFNGCCSLLLPDNITVEMPVVYAMHYGQDLKHPVIVTQYGPFSFDWSNIIWSFLHSPIVL